MEGTWVTERRRIVRKLRNRLAQRAIHLPRSLLLLIVTIVLDLLTEHPQRSMREIILHRQLQPDERVTRVAGVLAERYGLRRMREGKLSVRFIRTKPATRLELACLYDLKKRAHAAGDVDMVAVLDKAIYALRG